MGAIDAFVKSGTVTKIVEFAHGRDLLSSVLGHKGPTSMRTRLGQRIKGMRNRIFDLVGEEITERVQMDFRSDSRSQRSIYKLRLVEARLTQSP